MPMRLRFKPGSTNHLWRRFTTCYWAMMLVWLTKDVVDALSSLQAKFTNLSIHKPKFCSQPHHSSLSSSSFWPHTAYIPLPPTPRVLTTAILVFLSPTFFISKPCSPMPMLSHLPVNWPHNQHLLSSTEYATPTSSSSFNALWCLHLLANPKTCFGSYFLYYSFLYCCVL